MESHAHQVVDGFVWWCLRNVFLCCRFGLQISMALQSFLAYVFLCSSRLYLTNSRLIYVHIVIYSVHGAQCIARIWTIASNRIRKKSVTTDYILFSFYFMLFYFASFGFLSHILFSDLHSLSCHLYSRYTLSSFVVFRVLFFLHFFGTWFSTKNIVHFIHCLSNMRAIFMKKKLFAWLSLAFN